MNSDHESNEEKRFTFGVEGMTCVSCVRIVERNLNKLDKVHFASVNLATEKAYVIADGDTGIEEIREAVEKSGYGFIEKYEEKSLLEKDFNEALKSLKVSFLLFFPVTVLMIFHMAGVKVPGYHIIEFVFGIAAFLLPGRKIFRSAFIAAAHGHSNMDTLVALGAFSAWLTSGIKLAGANIVSFGALSVMLVFIHILGRYIESRLKYSASVEIRSLMSMRSTHATLVYGDETIEVPVESVKVDSLVAVRSGERIPLDGEIVEGKGYADESMLTGEPDRVKKYSGAEVTGGTVLESGFIKFRVTRAGEDTFLARMIKMVEDAQSSKVPLQALADRITVYFVPLIFIFAVVSSLIWFFLYDVFNPVLKEAAHYLPWIPVDSEPLSMAVFVFVAVLVIACPCALGLATPMALIAGTGAAASRGLLIKNGEAMQRAGEIEKIFLDKTGTLTRGEPSVVFATISEEDSKVVYLMEEMSVHPIAGAVLKYYSRFKNGNTMEASEVKETAGEGMSCFCNGEHYFFGRPENPELYSVMMKRGETVVELRKSGRVSGYVSIADPLKDDAHEAVERIKASGIVPVMLTGDNEETAKSVASSLGIEEVFAGVKPHEKLFAVQNEQKNGKRVAMVGDGINDAAALKASDMGIAIGSGTDLSIESADIIITGGELVSIIKAIEISKYTIRKIKQNLFWAFFYNLLAIPSAVAGLLSPVIAESCMIFSSINVILNSKRIKNKEF